MGIAAWGGRNEIGFNFVSLARTPARRFSSRTVNRIQNFRKELDFNVTDRINVSFKSSTEILETVNHYGEYIKNEVLADQITVLDNLDGEETELVDGISTVIKVTKI